jgi:hypothetical protein
MDFKNSSRGLADATIFMPWELVAEFSSALDISLFLQKCSFSDIQN